MSVEPIFKVNKLTNKNVIEKIYVFNGSNDKNKNKIFNNEELNYIEKNNVEVIFVNEQIHIDDNIGTIKLKIFEYCLAKSVSMSELYLFCLKSEYLNPITLYQTLTQNDRLPLTKVRLEQILLNIYNKDDVISHIDFNIEDKEKYSFDDILKLDLSERDYLVAKVLGQKIIFGKEYPFIADPFYVTEYDALLERTRKEITTLSTNLLLETGEIFNNNIFLCLAEDVFNYSEKVNISSEYTSKIYFPFLYIENINGLSELISNRNKLIENTLNVLTPDTQKTFENIDMFYNIYKNRTSSEQFNQLLNNTGITYIKIVIYPEFKIKIPIDVIFKLIHATETFPLVKFNPETRQENIYRLYTEQTSIDGRKIPYLNKATIFKLIRNIGKNKSVSIYTNIVYENETYHMVCEFADDGTIMIYPLLEFNKAILLNERGSAFNNINNIIKQAVNPLIEQIKPFFAQSGLELKLFETIESPSVEVRTMNYQTKYYINKTINIENYRGCLSSIFVIETSNLKKGIEMRFKRVSNFNKRDSQEAFIIEKIDQGIKFDEIVEELKKNYDNINDEIAIELIAKIRNELEVTRGANKRRSLMVKINPGFKTKIILNQITSEINVSVEGINNIYYLNTIPIYLDSVIRITQDIESTNVKSSLIRKLCSGNELRDIEFGQITALSEQSILENELPIIENESPIYLEEQGENMEELLNMLGYAEDEELIGGQQSDSSESISSTKDLSIDELEKITETNPVESVSKLKLDIPMRSNSVSEESSRELSSIEIPSEAEEELPSETKVSPIEIPSEIEVSSEELPSETKVSPGEIPSETKEELPEETKVSTGEIPSEAEEELPSETEVSTGEIPSEAEEELPSETKEELPEETEVSTGEIPSEAEEELPSETEVSTGEIPSEAEEELPSETKVSSEQEEELIEIKPSTTKKQPTTQSTVRNIVGMKLRYPNPFTSRLEERAPQLFIREKNEKYDLYTRMCPFSLSDRRQPIILTKQEKEEMIKEHPDVVNEEADFIEYSTDPNDSSKKFYYTCPRYWCLLTDKMVTEQDILDGKCGPKVNKIEDAIIPKSAKEVPKDKYVYQFYDKNEVKYPGFHKEKTPSGLCIPCCYNKWKTKEMKNRRDICQGKEPILSVSEQETKKEDAIKKQLEEAEQYIKGPEKYPLGDHRWGFLPISVQKFLHESNEDCLVSKTNINIKYNHTCLLRHGVEVNIYQSFIACIASAMFYAQIDEQTKLPLITKFLPNVPSSKIVPNIKEMKEIIINAINIDNFIRLQNGDLIETFANNDLEINIDDEKYVSSELYKKTKTTNELIFFNKVVQSYESFIQYLRNDNIFIDYTYLWDLICTPNPKLFEFGINLIVLEIPEDDTTNNIELVCPTNHYSTHVYDVRKRSLILVKRENFFEPIYGYKNNEKRLLITKMFSEFDRTLPQTLRAVFTKIIKPTLGEKCRPLVSRPNEYRFKQPVLLDNLIKELKFKKYKIIKQILNYQGKVIGIIAQNKKGLEGFIPCYPSSLTNLKQKVLCIDKSIDKSKCETDYLYDFVSDETWYPYEETFEFLKTYYDYEPQVDLTKTQCSDNNYFCHVIEDELVIGFLTNTNQFIRIKDPIPKSSISDELKAITNSDMLVADMNTLVNNKVDEDRVNFMKRIQLETNYYNVFRNTIRILFNDYSNSDKRKVIQEECNKRFILYKSQLDKVVDLLRNLVNDTIIFISNKDGYDYKVIDELNMNTCISNKLDKCTTNSMICKIIDNKCVLILPKDNLVTGTDNEVYYYTRMADELIRYNRIKSFIFRPQSYLSFGKIQYNLRDNEIIVLQSLLTQEFFEGLVPAVINKYAKYNSYDNTQPIISQTYSNKIILDEIINPNNIRDCYPTEPTEIQSVYWRKYFPNNYKEISYSDSKFCALYMLVDLIKEFNNIDTTIEQLKYDLIEQYKNITNDFTNTNYNKIITDILREEGQIDANQLLDETINFEIMILNDGFIPTNFDIRLLLIKYEIPSFFISKKLLPETRFNSKEFVCYTNVDKSISEYAFIFTPAMYRRKRNKLPVFKLILNENGNAKINITKLVENDNIKDAIRNYVSINEYIEFVYQKDLTTKYKPRKEGLRDLQFDILEEEGEEEKEEQLEIIPKPKKKKYKQKLKIEEEEEEEPIEIIPIKKTRKLKTNPLGRRKTKRKLPENIEIIEEEN
jgi:hypothetical protein